MKKKLVGVVLTIIMVLNISAIVPTDIAYEPCDYVPPITIVPFRDGGGNEF